jgi:hypothetical protein
VACNQDIRIRPRKGNNECNHARGTSSLCFIQWSFTKRACRLMANAAPKTPDRRKDKSRQKTNMEDERVDVPGSIFTVAAWAT